MGLRFDPLLNFVGREDTDYFQRATQAGAKLVKLHQTLVYEAPKRDSYQLAHMRFHAYLGRARIMRKHHGKSVFIIAGGALVYLIKGVMLALPALFSERQKKRSRHALAKGAGYLCSLFTSKGGEPYRNIVGD